MKTKRADLKILRDFYNYDAAKLVIFGSNVGASVDPLLYPDLPFAPAAITALAKTLHDKLVAMQLGGTPDTAGKNKAFDALADALNADANVIELTLGDDMEKLLDTGFLPVSVSHAQSVLDDTAIVSLQNNGTTQVLLQLLAVRNAKVYQIQISTDGGKTWYEPCLPSSNSRRIVIGGLTPGTTYLVRARAIGGLTGASNWTSPSSIMST